MKNVIDPKAGTHFPMPTKIFVTPHALDEAVKDFGIERSKAPMHVMDLLRKSALIDPYIVGDDGNPVRLFAYKRQAFIVSLDSDTVVTTYRRDSAADLIRNAVEPVLRRVLRAAQREEAAELKRLAVMKAELSVRRAECELAQLLTKRPTKARSLLEEITQIDAEITQINTEMVSARQRKSTLAKGICAYV